jgi:hypothetical protein
VAAKDGHFLHVGRNQDVEGIAYYQDGTNGHIEQDIRQHPQGIRTVLLHGDLGAANGVDAALMRIRGIGGNYWQSRSVGLRLELEVQSHGQ